MGRMRLFALLAGIGFQLPAAEVARPIDVDLLSKAPGDPTLGPPNRAPSALATRVEYPVEFNTRAFATAAGSIRGRH